LDIYYILLKRSFIFLWMQIKGLYVVISPGKHKHYLLDDIN